MRTGRVEAFSDGVLAILITIMVLELPKPDGVEWRDLGKGWHGLLAYALSFAYIGIYWNNHHHVFQAVRRIRGGVLWANLHLLFWLSLVPFITGWLSDMWDPRKLPPVVPVAVYGIVLLLAGIAFSILQATLIRAEGPGSVLAAAVGRDLKGKGTPVLYVAGILLSFVQPWLGLAAYLLVALIWFIPDSRVERQLARDEQLAGPPEG